jgi:hypothetical protein
MVYDRDNFYLDKPEPLRSCLQALRAIVLDYHEDITEAWKYRMPFFCVKGKMFCYLWVDKKTKQPYVGIVEGRKINHPQLISAKRSRMKVMFVDPANDIPVKTLRAILKLAMRHYS